MKKKAISALLAVTMVATLAAGCGSSDDTAATSDTSTTDTTDTADTSDAEEAEDTDAADEAEEAATGSGSYSGDITIWVAEEVVDFTKSQAEEWKAANAGYADCNINVEPVGEGDAASNMITDVVGGADIYGFAQDQLARLVSAGAIQEVSSDYVSTIESNNDTGSVGAASVGGTVYAFPLTSDNGYFLYYDSSVITDPSSLEKIMEDAEAAGKNVYMEINSGWYQTAFFFGTGCTLEYETDSDGNFTSCTIDYASDEGVAALKAIINLHKSPSFQNGSAASNATNMCAIVDGTWDSGAIKDILGDNYACAKLPTFNVDGTDYQMTGFGGYKLLGVKPQEDADKLAACMSLADYLSSGDVQLARYDEVGWGPSNLEAQKDDKITSDPALSALAEQLALAVPQGQYPNDYWTDATSLGDSIIAGDYDNATDEELMETLEAFSATEQSYAGQ